MSMNGPYNRPSMGFSDCLKKTMSCKNSSVKKAFRYKNPAMPCRTTSPPPRRRDSRRSSVPRSALHRTLLLVDKVARTDSAVLITAKQEQARN